MHIWPRTPASEAKGFSWTERSTAAAVDLNQTLMQISCIDDIRLISLQIYELAESHSEFKVC